MLPPDSTFFCAVSLCLRIHIMKITYMVFQTPQILRHYQFVFQKHKHGHNSCKYCLSLPTCLNNAAVLTECSSAMCIPELHAMPLNIKKRKVLVFFGANQIYSVDCRNIAQPEKFKMFYIFHSPPEI